MNMSMPQEELRAQSQRQQKQQAPPNPEQQTTPDERKAENQRKADLLRAKLIAQRQNTPMKGMSTSASSRPDTPAQTPAPTSAPKMHETSQPLPASVSAKPSEDQASSGDAHGIDELLAEGLAAAQARKQDDTTKQSELHSPVKTNGHVKTAKSAVQPNITANMTSEVAPVKASLNRQQEAAPPTSLVEPYYADLPAWLEFTGYHDLAYRTSKLGKYNERRQLEEEAARIHERLEMLRRDEQAEMEALRSNLSHPTTSAAAPPLPSEMPSQDAAGAVGILTNGVKRLHSPGPNEKVSRRREEGSTGFRIRGANDSPSDSRPPRRTSPPPPVDRRVTYPDARRRGSLDMPRSRDPSLERRQSFYRRDGDRPAPPPANPRYDGYPPRDRDMPPRFAARDGCEERAPRGASSYRGGRGGYRDHQSYRGGSGGSISSDLAKGGQSSITRRG